MILLMILINDALMLHKLFGDVDFPGDVLLKGSQLLK